MNIACIQWEYEDELPEMCNEEFDIIYKQSKVRDGVRMYPYVWSEDEHGEPVKMFLG